MTKQRQSNFELLRILAIFMVLMHHSLLDAAKTCGYLVQYTLEDGYMGVMLNSMCIIGVNLFILITGWFGCKYPFRNIGRILIEVVLLSGITYLLGVACNLTNFVFVDFLKSMNFLHNWFIVAYVMLLFMVPVLETALSDNSNYGRLRLSSVEFIFSRIDMYVMSLLVVAVFFGWVLQYLNVDGYNMLNFVLLYVLSRWLRIKIESGKLKTSRWSLFSLYILMSIILTVLFILYFGVTKHESSIQRTMHFMGYNNPFVLISAVCIFLLFQKIRIQSNLINKLAISVLGVFIIHGVPYVASLWRGGAIVAFQSYSYVGLFFFDVAIFCSFLFVSYLLNILFVKPAVRLYLKCFFLS